MGNLNITASEHEELGNYDAIPVGEYKVILSNTEEKTSNTSGDRYFSFEYQVVEGEFEGRKLWDVVAIFSSNPKAVAIAKRKVAAVCRALNKASINDTVELHDQPMVAVVGQRKDQQSGEMRNNIKNWKPVSEYSASSATTSGESNDDPF